MTNIDQTEELATIEGGVYWPGTGCFPLPPFPRPYPIPGRDLGIIGGGQIVCLDGANVY